MNTVLVTGGCGLIGSSIPGDDLILTDILPGAPVHLDVTDAEETRAVIALHKPCAVVHCAAWIEPDQCERDPLGGFKVNVMGTQNVLAACKAAGAKMVYLSTQLVFDGAKQAPYAEEDACAPLQQYGLTHFCAEQYARGYDNHLIIRTSLCHGCCRNGRVYGFVYWVLDSLRAGKTIDVVDSFWTTPTVASEVGAALRTLIERNAVGTYHCAGNRYLNRYEYAVAAAQKAGLDASRIRKIGVADLMKKWVARRPLHAGLDSGKLRRDCGIAMGDPLDSIA